jgi:Protein of unknown function (DUF551)
MSDWIKCSERMPDKDGRYLIVENYGWHRSVGVCSLHQGKWDMSSLITHWQLLPEPPEEE